MANRFSLIENLEPEGPKSLPKKVLLVPIQGRYNQDFIKIGQIYRQVMGTQFDYCRVINSNTNEFNFYVEIKWLTGYRLLSVMNNIWDSKTTAYITIEKVNDTDKFYSIDSFNAYNFEYVSEY